MPKNAGNLQHTNKRRIWLSCLLQFFSFKVERLYLGMRKPTKRMLKDKTKEEVIYRDLNLQQEHVFSHKGHTKTICEQVKRLREYCLSSKPQTITNIFHSASGNQ